jgi:hypothetical protein
MIRSTISLVAAVVITLAGYAALGVAAHTSPQPTLKVIAVVVAHARHHSAVSALRAPGGAAAVQ